MSDTAKTTECKPPGPKPLSGSGSALIARMRRQPPGRLLDCPAGEGWLARKMTGHGFEVTLADIDPDRSTAHGFDCARVDLNTDKLPFENESFEYIACAGGLHRLYCVRHCLDEFRRVLAPKGKLYVGTINSGSLIRRLGFLFAGRLGKRIEKQAGQDLGQTPSASFRTGLTCREIVIALKAAGFTVKSSRPARLSARAILLAPLALSLWLVGKLCFTPGEPLSVLMGGRHAVIVAEKL